MKTRHVIAIGILSAITISLIAFGIKSKDFKKPILTNAEDLYPISKKWLMNSENISYDTNNFNNTINYKTWLHPQSGNNAQRLNGTNLYVNRSSYTNGTVYSLYTTPNPTYWSWYNTHENSGRYQSKKFNNNASRIIEFETEPTGNLYTMLNTSGLPAYNSDILLFGGNIKSTYQNGTYTFDYAYQDNCITEIRKNSLPISKEDIRQGNFINEDGIIQIFLDAGITSLKINGTEYIGTNTQTINITNDDIMIESAGTNSGNTSSIFTINYFNTRPPINPQPYPDPGEQIVEVIPIVPMMFQILTMPFTFITTAFNVTLWEGTPYQFNFSNFIYSLIAIATLIFIIKLFTSGFSVIGNYTYNKADKDFKKSQTRLNNAKAGNIERNAPKKTESKVTIKKE